MDCTADNSSVLVLEWLSLSDALGVPLTASHCENFGLKFPGIAGELTYFASSARKIAVRSPSPNSKGRHRYGSHRGLSMTMTDAIIAMRHLLNAMRGRQHDVGGDEGAATNVSLVGRAGDGQILKHGAHVGPLAELRRRTLRVRHDPLIDVAHFDAIGIALSTPSACRLLPMIKFGDVQ